MSMRKAGYGWLVFAVLNLVLLTRATQAAIINGNFQTGDLTGWTASAIDRSLGPVTALIAVASVGSNQLAVFDTGDLATGPFVSTLEQSFVVDSANPFLSFEFSGRFTTPDASGAGKSPFLDAFAVSLASGGQSYELLLFDQKGAAADPFGTAPGAVALGVAMPSNLAMTLSADLSSLAGQSVTLFADIINEDDALEASVQFDNVVLQDELIKKTVIPEPASLTLWSLALAASAVAKYRRAGPAG